MKKIMLSKLPNYKICELGEKVNKYNNKDISYTRTVVCDNSYLTVKTTLGENIIKELKKDFSF